MHELEGLAQQTCPQAGMRMEFGVTDNLFRLDGDNAGDDLPARNIQRGRDHGIPDYSELRSYCRLPAFFDTEYEWRPTEIREKEWNELRSLYEYPWHIDPYPAGLAETPVEGGLVGPTFACIIGEQFRALRKADRYFFSHPSKGKHNERGLGTSHTRKSVQKRRLGDIMCDNTRDPETGIQELRELVMETEGEGNLKQPCGAGRGTQGRDLDWQGIVKDIVNDLQ